MMNKLWLAVLLALIVGIFTVPTSAAETMVVSGEEHCVVNVSAGDRLNIRSGPSSGYRIVARKAYGSCGVMVVGDCRVAWCPVEDGHFKGWVNRQFISMVSPALYCTVGNGQDKIHLRAFPSIKSRVLVALNRHTCGIAFLPYSRGSWQKIRVDGWEGWIQRASVSGE